jgi:hypothetical protein
MSTKMLILSKDDKHHKLEDLGSRIANWSKKVDRIETGESHDRGMLASEQLDGYDVCVEQGIIDFVRGGQVLIGIHSATVTDETREGYIELIGGRFTHHSHYHEFEVQVQEREHPVTSKVDDFKIPDELYVLDREPKGARVLATAIWEDGAQPLLYTKSYGQGQVLYNAFGHDKAAFDHPTFHKLIVQGLQWARDVIETSRLLALYPGLRVTDVCDGLDAVGLIDTCTMDWEIRPLWRDVQDFGHRIYGVAHTVRFVPTAASSPAPCH